MQIFHRSANSLARISIVALIGLVALLGWLGLALFRSRYVTRQSEVLPQPVPFSHNHHVAGLGIDCRYCHTSVERSATAGIPPIATCINCHKQIWTNAELLEPVRAAYASKKPVQWAKVHDLPDYVYFNHSVHVAKGIGCVSCHGRVDQMPLMYQAQPLTMEWCLSCHRDPVKNLRPRSEVTNMRWEPPGDAAEAGALRAHLAKEYNVRSLMSCSTCHR
jgi:hypothetical protein